MADINTIDVADAGLGGRIWAFFNDLSARLEQRRIYRETYNELAALNGRELADLGISRSQIRGLAHETAYGKL